MSMKAAEVHVADERRLVGAGDVVLDEHLVLEHADLDLAVARAHDHAAVDGLAAGQVLRLREDGAAAAGVAAVAAALLLGLEARGALDALRLGDELGLLAGRADLDDGAGRVVAVAALLAGAAACAAADRRGVVLVVAVVVAVAVAAVAAGAALLAASASARGARGAVVAVEVVVVVVASVVASVVAVAAGCQRRQRGDVRCLEEDRERGQRAGRSGGRGVLRLGRGRGRLGCRAGLGRALGGLLLGHGRLVRDGDRRGLGDGGATRSARARRPGGRRLLRRGCRAGGAGRRALGGRVDAGAVRLGGRGGGGCGARAAGASGDRRLLLGGRGLGVVVLVQGSALRFGGGGRAARLGICGRRDDGRAVGLRCRGRPGTAAREPLEEARTPPAGVLVSLHHLWCTPQPGGTAAPCPGSSPSGSPRTRFSVDPWSATAGPRLRSCALVRNWLSAAGRAGRPGCARERLFMAAVPRGGSTCLPVSHAEARPAVRVAAGPSAMIAR
jgi:hypothetical protein